MSARRVLKTWIQAIEQGDLDKVVALYAPNAILIPTFADKILDSPQKIRSYFRQMLKREGLSITLDSAREQRLGADRAIVSGFYTWRYMAEGQAQTRRARFTFVVAPGSSAPILHQHSSLCPGSR